MTASSELVNECHKRYLKDLDTNMDQIAVKPKNKRGLRDSPVLK